MSIGTYAAALHTAHAVADFWIQTEHQAAHKAAPGSAGWTALLGHVGSYTATQGLAVLAAAGGTRPSVGRFTAALAVSGLAHGWADRRHTLAGLAARTGKRGFWQVSSAGLSGSFQLDQSWHHLTSVLVPALLLAAGEDSHGQR